MTKRTLSQGFIFKFWVPLASTWLMMSVEGPFLAAVIARMAEAKFNLAAYGVAFAMALLFESPIILMMSASTALVQDRESLLRLRNFCYSLNAVISALMALCLIPQVFNGLARDLIGLPPEVAALAYRATLVLLPWPAAIGYRRFYQGILIRSGRTRLVAYGTIVRLGSMSGVALLLSHLGRTEGCVTGTAALSAGVVMEAIVSRFMAAGSVRHLLALSHKGGLKDKEALTYFGIARFYYPLALTAMLTMGVNPLVTFFLGQSRLPVESLAVMPVVNSLVFIFRSLGLAFQDVGIALLGEKGEGYLPLRRFAAGLGTVAVGGLAAIAYTPIMNVWFHHLSGLTMELTAIAAVPVRILAFMPAFSVLLSFQHAMLVAGRETRPITWATIIEVCGVGLCLVLGIRYLGMVGADAAACALMLGRIGAVAYLAAPVGKVKKGSR
jgi:Na+-driven multidrug efflux pump